MSRRRHRTHGAFSQRRRSQTTTYNPSSQDTPPPYFGDPPRRVRADRFRIANINLDNLPKEMNKDKDEQLFRAIVQYDINILTMQELGLNWSRVSRDHSWHERVKEYLKQDASQTKSKMSHNIHDKTGEPDQWGGTGIMAYGKIAKFAMGAGSDPSGLGRWTWTRYRGKHGMALRIVSIYQPTDNKRGTIAVYQQHKVHMQSNNDDRCPRAAFMEDLDHAITTWLTAGDQLIICGDINDDVLSNRIKTFFGQHNLRNLMFDRHNAANAPPTYFRTSSDRIVDGMWGTPNVQVSRSGYLEPGDFPGNHSLLWMDITYECALGHNPPMPVYPDARRLQLWNTKCVDKYLNKYEKDVVTHNLDIRQRNFERTTVPGTRLTPAQAVVANSIDFQRRKLMQKAEKKCRHLRFGAVAFSEATRGPTRRIEFWEKAIRRRKGVRVSSTLWRRLKAKAKITVETSNLSLEDLFAELKKARQDYQAARKNHRDERVAFLDTLSPKDRDRLKRREAARENGRIAKLINGKLESKSVTQIEINGQECTRKVAIENALKDINYKKLRASDDTAFLMHPLRQEFGDRNDTPASDQVLQGTYQPPPQGDRYAKLLLQGLRQPPTLRPEAREFHPRTSITVDDHIRSWKRAKERTSAGPSGLHFGMFKANIRRYRLAALDASIRNVAYTTGFSYSRWKHGLDVQLLKRSQDFRAEKLRTILLLEADFNMNNKILGSDAMRSGERSGTLNRDNLGSRKDMQASEVAMNSQLTYNSILARRGRAVVMSNDAAGCYDRIAHTVVHLALARLGIPKPALNSMIETIQEMEHYIRTAFGDSDTPYKRKAHDPPPQGVLQGNGAGPAGWASISTVLIDIMHQAGFGYHDWSLIRDRAISLCCFAFVDDTDIVHVNNDPLVSTEALIAEAQEALDLWAGLLRATGGNLAPEKSYWYLLEVTRSNGKWTYKTASQAPGDLFLNQGQHRIRRNEVHVAEEALGIQASPDGSMRAELKYLKGKVAKWCDAIRTKRIKPSEAWYCLNATIMKTIEYPLMATSFSRAQIDDLMKPLLKTALPLSGIQSRMPRKLVYGTLRSRGCNIHYPYWSQLIAHLQAILRHQHRDTPSCDLHNDNIEAIQLHVGSQHPFWELPFPQYGMLAPSGWIANTWESLQETPLSIKGQDITISARRERDVWLMDAFIALNVTEDDLLLLNDCRLYLQATTLSDICSANGQVIDDEAWLGTPSIHAHPRRWIKTYKPGRDAWILWRHYLRQAFLYPHAPHRRLRQPLGPWLTATDDSWIWWKHIGTSCIYQQLSDKQWMRWSLRPSRTLQHRPLYHHPTPVPAKPSNCVRANITRPRNRLTIREVNWGIAVPPIQPPPTIPPTLADRLQRLPDTAAWALRYMHRTDEGTTIAQAITNGSAVAVSDGSLKLGFGTSAYIIEGDDHTNLITGVNQVPGPIADGDSHRCEVAGLYSMALVVQAIVAHHQVTNGRITVACDNETALRIFDPEYQPKPNDKNFDLVSATWNIVRNTKIRWKGTHVKGHQDDTTTYATLPRLAKLNVDMDRKAKAFWNHLCVHAGTDTFPSPLQHPIHGEGWQIWIGDRKISTPSTKVLYSEIQDPITQMWWVRHNNIPAEALDQADWDATSDALSHLPLPRRRWTTKHASENCGVGDTLLRWKKQDDNKCPRCGAPEDTIHIYKCTGQGATETWNASMKRLESFLATNDTDPDLHTGLIDCLTRWRQDRPIPIQHYPPAVRQVLWEQHKLGWKNLLEGLPSIAWRRHQHQYFAQQGLQKSSRQWVRHLLQHTHHLAWHQWDHRNTVKHKTVRPRHQRAVVMLDREIIREYSRGLTTLLPADRHHLRHNIVNLLDKPLRVKKAWFVNVTTARIRYDRLLHQDNERTRLSEEASKLLRWMRGKSM